MDTFDRLESVVRSYSRTWPTVFTRAAGDKLFAEDGTEYIDFFAGAGALNYGHNNPRLKRLLIDYITNDNVTHSLDMSTVAKRTFLERFDEVILRPRNLSYKVQFPGPTGTNSVEAALKLARKVTGRETVVGFTNGFHGMTLGSLSVTGNGFKRAGAGVPLGQASSMPFDGYMGEDIDTLDYLEAFLQDSGSGLDRPAGIIVETVQAEGGVNAASFPWLRRLASVCKEYGILFIADDIQVGCGRTGPFFSFEPAGITPDIVCLSKSLSGYGLPMAVTLIRPDLDIWEPGEHNGTFRGINPAFVTATGALGYWETSQLTEEVASKEWLIRTEIERIAEGYPEARLQTKGRGMIQGLKSMLPAFASQIVKEAFDRRLIIETSGPESEVVKLLPPLTVDGETLREGLARLADSVKSAADKTLTTPALVSA